MVLFLRCDYSQQQQFCLCRIDYSSTYAVVDLAELISFEKKSITAVKACEFFKTFTTIYKRILEKKKKCSDDVLQYYPCNAQCNLRLQKVK
jgi:hypothetical protein